MQVAREKTTASAPALVSSSRFAVATFPFYHVTPVARCRAGQAPLSPRAAAVQRAVPHSPAISAGVQLHADSAVLRHGGDGIAAAAAARVSEVDERHDHGARARNELQPVRADGAGYSVRVYLF